MCKYTDLNTITLCERVELKERDKSFLYSTCSEISSESDNELDGFYNRYCKDEDTIFTLSAIRNNTGMKSKGAGIFGIIKRIFCFE